MQPISLFKLFLLYSFKKDFIPLCVTLNVVRAIFPQYGVLVLRYKPAYRWRAGALCTVRSWSKYAEGCHLTKTNVVCLKIQYKYLVRRIRRRPCSLRITFHVTPAHSMFRVDFAMKFITNSSSSIEVQS